MSPADAVPEDVEVSTFEALFARERPAMLRLAVLLVGSAAVAEEVVQDSFVAVSERWRELDRPGGYLRTTVVNGCRAVMRRREVERRHAALSTGPGYQEFPTHLVEVREALECLSERQRIVIVMRFYVGASEAEIADVLDCRRSTVRSLSRRGMSVMRRELT